MKVSALQMRYKWKIFVSLHPVTHHSFIYDSDNFKGQQGRDGQPICPTIQKTDNQHHNSLGDIPGKSGLAVSRKGFAERRKCS